MTPVDVLVLGVRLVVAVLLLVAALHKVRGPEKTAAFLRAVGAGPRAARRLAPWVPAAEVAAALVIGLPVVPAPVAGGVTCAVGAAFSVLQVLALTSGRPAACPCFGGSGAVSGRTLGRAVAVLLAGCVVVAAG